MSAVKPTTCVDFVKRAFPFQLSEDFLHLATYLCSKGVNPELVAWLVLLLVLKPHAFQDEEQPTTEVVPPEPSAEFNWKLWFHFTRWARTQQTPIPLRILRQVFEQVCSNQISSIEEAVALVNALIRPSTTRSPRRRTP